MAGQCMHARSRSNYVTGLTEKWSVRRTKQMPTTDDRTNFPRNDHAKTDSMTSSSGNSSITTTAALAAAAAATFSIGAALGARFASSKSKSSKQNLCECGFDLTNCHSNQQIERHMQSTLHKSNLKRSRGAPLLLTGKINEYRAAITTHVDPDDIVLEVGCAEGLTTQRLAQRCKVAIGLDLYERLITRARRRIGKPPENIDGDRDDAVDVHPVDAPEGRGWSNLHFHTADALDKEAKELTEAKKRAKQYGLEIDQEFDLARSRSGVELSVEEAQRLKGVREGKGGDTASPKG